MIWSDFYLSAYDPLPQSLMLRLICFDAAGCLHLGLGEAIFFSIGFDYEHNYF